MSYSKLTVKNLGKIKEAEIELSDLVLFIGDNNSGKSYLMTLIYGFANYSEEIVNILFQDKDFLFNLKEYKDIEDLSRADHHKKMSLFLKSRVYRLPK